ncbi:hypothetical protein EVAR_68256_1 [Eumeta japonica]|uniref:Uncharacterized protein n=1 Tax=Eumeta variegata TaxID=151549 RepID=A0A4C1ZS69_EUMVA|nr:hypothetical protein EVAR_68256_1 [Eumeta japonica]
MSTHNYAKRSTLKKACPSANKRCFASMDIGLIASSFGKIDVNHNPGLVLDPDLEIGIESAFVGSHTFNSDSNPVFVFDPTVLNFDSSAAFDSDLGPVLDCIPPSAFIYDSTTSHSSDLDEA